MLPGQNRAGALRNNMGQIVYRYFIILAHKSFTRCTNSNACDNTTEFFLALDSRCGILTSVLNRFSRSCWQLYTTEAHKLLSGFVVTIWRDVGLCSGAATWERRYVAQGHEVAVRRREILLHDLLHPRVVGSDGVAIPMSGRVWCLHGASFKFVSFSGRVSRVSDMVMYVSSLSWSSLLLWKSAPPCQDGTLFSELADLTSPAHGHELITWWTAQRALYVGLAFLCFGRVAERSDFVHRLMLAASSFSCSPPPNLHKWSCGMTALPLRLHLFSSEGLDWKPG